MTRIPSTFSFSLCVCVCVCLPVCLSFFPPFTPSSLLSFCLCCIRIPCSHIMVSHTHLNLTNFKAHKEKGNSNTTTLSCHRRTTPHLHQGPLHPANAHTATHHQRPSTSAKWRCCWDSWAPCTLACKCLALAFPLPVCLSVSVCLSLCLFFGCLYVLCVCQSVSSVSSPLCVHVLPMCTCSHPRKYAFMCPCKGPCACVCVCVCVCW